MDYVFVVRMIFNQRQVPGKFEKRQKKKFKVELSDVGFMYNTHFAKRLMLGGGRWGSGRLFPCNCYCPPVVFK